MVKAGAFDDLAHGQPGARSSFVLDRIVATAQREAQMRSSGQSSLFGGESGARTVQEEPGIALGTNDAPPGEKAGWERELLGVALSHNPLMALSGAAGDANAVVSVDQLSEEMQGQTVTVLGIVSTVTERARRDGQRFFIVALDMLGGQLEVIIWPESLQRTEEVWHPGRTLRVAGKVRLRGEQVELVCDDAEEYASDRPSTLTVTPSQPARANGNGYGNGSGAQARTNGNRNGNGNGNSNGNGYASASPNGNGHSNGNGGNGSASPPANPSNGSGRLVRLIVTEDDQKHDANTLREVIGVMLEYPGRDRVNLEIRSAGRRVLLDMPVVSTGYCEDLRDRVEDILGPDTVAVSQEMSLGV